MFTKTGPDACFSSFDVWVEGNQTEEGKDMVIIGNMANGNDIEEYALI